MRGEDECGAITFLGASESENISVPSATYPL